MSKKYYKNKLKLTKKLYFSIARIPCPTLNNEMIYFEWDGFRHLIRKGRKQREIKDQLRRFRLFEHAVMIIKNGKEVSEKRIETSKIPIAEFFTIGLLIQRKMIKVVLRRVGDDKLHFFSIMD
jgi:hypothetical protein